MGEKRARFQFVVGIAHNSQGSCSYFDFPLALGPGSVGHNEHMGRTSLCRIILKCTMYLVKDKQNDYQVLLNLREFYIED